MPVKLIIVCDGARGASLEVAGRESGGARVVEAGEIRVGGVDVFVANGVAVFLREAFRVFDGEVNKFLLGEGAERL
jgi:hypothetical protein